MKSERTAFAERLNRLLAEKHIEASPAELAPLLFRRGKVVVSQQAVSGWLHGRFMPKLANQRALAAALGVELSALHVDSKQRQVRESPGPWSEGLDGKDQLALQEFATLPAAQRKLVRELIAALAAAVTRSERS